MAFDPPSPRREPIINAPVVVTATAAMLVALHAVTYLTSDSEYLKLQSDFALWPQRFWAPGGSEMAYENPLQAGLTLISTALLHSGWMHVLTNSAMLLAFGAPSARVMGPGWGGAAKWTLLFVGAVAAGSLLYLVVRGGGGPPAVGASGGTSGLMAAAFLFGPSGRMRSPFSREFLTISLAFAFINLVLVLAGPQLLGAPIAWEAHAGGFAGGAAMMLLLAPQHLRPRLLRR